MRLGDRVIRSAGRPDRRRRPGAPVGQRARLAVRRRRAGPRRRDRRDRRLGRAGACRHAGVDAVAGPARSPPGILVTRDGTRTAVGERPARLAVDDGSAPDVVLLSDGEDAGEATLVGRDATSGEELWRLTGTSGEVLLVDGVVHVAHGHEVRALDARTGESRWLADVGAPPVYLGTDGSLVVVVTADRTLRRARPGRRTARQRGRRRPAPGPRPGRRRPGERVRRAAARAVPRRVGDRRRLSRLTCPRVTPGCGPSTPVWHDDGGPSGDPSFGGPCHRGHS